MLQCKRIVSNVLTRIASFGSLKNIGSQDMTMVKTNGSIRTTWLRGAYYFVSFMGRYACGRPEKN